MNSNVKVIGLTRLGMKPESTASETDVLTTRPSEVVNCSADPMGEFIDLPQNVCFLFSTLLMIRRVKRRSLT